MREIAFMFRVGEVELADGSLGDDQAFQGVTLNGVALAPLHFSEA